MAKLVVSIEAKGAAFYVTHVIPPCADGTPNAAALAAFLAKGREIAPEAYDPTKAPEPDYSEFIISGSAIAAARFDSVALTDDDIENCRRINEALAQLHHDEAEAPNPLNTADTVGPSEG